MANNQTRLKNHLKISASQAAQQLGLGCYEPVIKLNQFACADPVHSYVSIYLQWLRPLPQLHCVTSQKCLRVSELFTFHHILPHFLCLALLLFRR